jgi:zinc protease
LAIIAVASSSVVAQKVAPKKPAAVKTSRASADTGTISFDASGVQVILRRNPANDVIAANLYLLGGVRNVPASKVGLEPFLLSVSEQGTAKYPKAKLRDAMARLGTGLPIDADHDWTMFGVLATSATIDSTWSVFADRLMHPLLDSAEIEFIRAQMLSGVRQRRDDPDNYLEFLADSVAFAGHPYGLIPTGTEASIASLTRADLLKFEREQMVKSRMMLVVVGNVTRPQIEKLIKSTIGTLPAGAYHWTVPPPLPHGSPALAVDPRNLPTNYLLGYFAGPAATSPDYVALRVACAVLSGQLFTEIRGRQNLTYAVNAPFVERAYAAAGLYVSTVAPDSVLSLMRGELDVLVSETVDPSGLRELVNQFVTDYYLDNETNSKQANGLARAQLYRGDWRATQRFLDELRAVTPEDIRRVAKQYFTGLRLAYIGDPRRLTRSRVAAF